MLVVEGVEIRKHPMGPVPKWGPPVFRWQRTLAKNPLGVAPGMYTPKCAPQRAPCSGAVYLACFASARALGPGNSQVPPSHAPIIIWHNKIKTKRSHTRYTPPLDSFSRVQLPCGLSVLLFQQQGARARAEGASRACCTACIYGGGVVVVILGFSGNSRFLVGSRWPSFF